MRFQRVGPLFTQSFPSACHGNVWLIAREQVFGLVESNYRAVLLDGMRVDPGSCKEGQRTG